MSEANPRETSIGSKYREVRETEGSRNRDSTVVESKLPFLLCFTLYLRDIFPSTGTSTQGTYIWKDDLMEGFFCFASLGGAYFRNFKLTEIVDIQAIPY